MLLQLGTAVCIWRWWPTERLPNPGYAVAIVAGVAAAMSIHADMRGWQKSLWMVLIGFLLVIELRSISNDRAEANTKATHDRKLQDDAFRIVLDKEDAVFSETLRGFREESDRMIGGHSFPWLSVQVIGGPAPYAEFLLRANGTNPLRNLNVSFGQSSCTVDSKSNISEAGGSMNFQRYFDTYNGPSTANYLPNIVAGPYMLRTSRAVFFGYSSALNASWYHLVKFRLEDSAWAWRSVVYESRRGIRRVVSDTRSPNYPEIQYRRPMEPITKDDCVYP